VSGCDASRIRNINTTEQSPAMDVAFITVRLSDGRIGHQPIVMRNASAKLQKTVEELQAAVAQLTQQLKEQGAQIQKVSAQIEASKPAPQVVNNP
jgi:septal ring factor EnvC (AmiA/AmiB activator)